MNGYNPLKSAYRGRQRRYEDSVPAPGEYFRWFCPHCRYDEVTAADELFRRLQAIGAMKRAEKPDEAVAFELARAAAERLACPRCEQTGLQIEHFAQTDDFDDEWGPPKPCVACGTMIPGERVMLFPNVELCTACQAKLDSGSTTAGDDYCPHCGTPMTIRKGRAAGITRYALICPSCRR